MFGEMFSIELVVLRVLRLFDLFGVIGHVRMLFLLFPLTISPSRPYSLITPIPHPNSTPQPFPITPL